MVLTLITSIPLQAQKYQIYSNSFDVNEQTTAIFNLEKTTVSIEESTDDKMHLDYRIEFENYHKSEIQLILDNINVEANLFSNHLTLTASSITKVADITYKIKTLNSLVIKEEFFKLKENSNNTVRKHKDSVIKEINKSPKEIFKDFFKAIKTEDKNGKSKKINKSNVKIMKSHFIIKIPPYLKLTINGKESQVTLFSDFENELRVILKRGFFKAKQLNNTYNKIKIEDADFKVEGIIGGDYTLNSIRKGLIGSIENAKITSEFSKIEIGEINNNVAITDFNSKYWFYNWSKDFTRFDLFSEYSKIYCFFPKTNYSLKVVGNNTFNHFDNVTIEMQPTKNEVKFNMMEVKVKGKSKSSGHINFDIVHGVIYTFNNMFYPNKN
jgi:hypothetical protein